MSQKCSLLVEYCVHMGISELDSMIITYTSSTGMLWVPLDMGMSAAHCQGNVREFHSVWRVVTLISTFGKSLCIVWWLLMSSVVMFDRNSQSYGWWGILPVLSGCIWISQFSDTSDFEYYKMLLLDYTFSSCIMCILVIIILCVYSVMIIIRLQGFDSGWLYCVAKVHCCRVQTLLFLARQLWLCLGRRLQELLRTFTWYSTMLFTDAQHNKVNFEQQLSMPAFSLGPNCISVVWKAIHFKFPSCYCWPMDAS